MFIAKKQFFASIAILSSLSPGITFNTEKFFLDPEFERNYFPQHQNKRKCVRENKLKTKTIWLIKENTVLYATKSLCITKHEMVMKKLMLQMPSRKIPFKCFPNANFRHCRQKMKSLLRWPSHSIRDYKICLCSLIRSRFHHNEHSLKLFGMA